MYSDFENYIKDVQLKIREFCKKYNFFSHKNDLFQEAYICYMKCLRTFKGKGDLLKNLEEILKFLCKCEQLNLKDLKQERFKISLKCNNCELKILLCEDLKNERIDRNSRVIVFENITSLENPDKSFKNKRIFIFAGKNNIQKEMIWDVPEFRRRKVFILTQTVKKKNRKGFRNCFININRRE